MISTCAAARWRGAADPKLRRGCRPSISVNPDKVLVARVPLPRGQYTTAAGKHRFFRAVLDRIHALPGVVVTTETTTLPP